MNSLLLAICLIISVLLSSCRGGDETDIVEPRFPRTEDPGAFNAFLNPLPAVPLDGVSTGDIHNVQDFPQAYYNTIDPDNTRDTFFKWRVENGFLNADGTEATCEPATCRQTHVRFRDTKDLGYGRNMFMRWNTVTNDVAIYVENFQVDSVPGVPYGPLNLDALINNDRQWNFGVNAIEFSAFPAVGVGDRKFTKFYNFAGDGNRTGDVSGTQQHFVDLDNRGPKPMPSTCIVCHGGRNETLVYRTSQGTLKLAPTLVGGIAGDLQAHMQMIDFNSLQFAIDEPGFRAADNADGIRMINEAVLFSYRYRQEQFTGDGDWDAELAIEIVEGHYGGDPGDPANAYDEQFVPVGWSADRNLYRTLTGPNCLVCHALRGTLANRPPVNQENGSAAFPDLSGFRNYSEQIDHLIFEQGKMPLGLLNYHDFWDRKEPAAMAFALGLGDRIDANDRAIRPGAPVAQINAPSVAAGIDAAGAILDIAISGSGSAFAIGEYRWAVTPATASIVSTGLEGEAVLRASVADTYTLTLTVDGINGGTHSSSQTVRVFNSNDAGAPTPDADIRYFGSGGINELMIEQCVECHSPNTIFSTLPVHYTACRSDDFNGNEFLYRSVLARVNFESPLDSLFLRKPSNGSTDPVERTTSEIEGYHAGGYVLEQDADYSRILSWILNGAQPGVVPGADTIDAGSPLCTPSP